MLLDASSTASAELVEALYYGWGGRPSPAWRLRADLDYFGRELASRPSQNSQHIAAATDLGLRLADPIEAESSLSIHENASPGLSSLSHLRGIEELGFRYSVTDDLELRCAFVAEQDSYPSYDLDSSGLGGRASASLELPLGLHASAGVRRVTRSYAERKLSKMDPGTVYVFPTPTGTPVPVPILIPAASDIARHDEDLDWNAGLDWSEEGTQIGLSWHETGRRSNDNRVDWGPFQDANHNLQFPGNQDESLVADSESYIQSGPELSARMQALDWLRLSCRAATTHLAYAGRTAKDASDHFVAGLPSRRDQSVDSELRADLGFACLGLDYDLALSWDHTHSTSNDALFNFDRDLGRAVLSLDF